MQQLRDKNKPYRQGLELARQGDLEEAVRMLTESRALATNVDEKAVIDFTIAGASFDLKRSTGIENFIALAKNESYKERTRALAMVRGYLLYAKYNDPDVLMQLATAFGIPWTIPEVVINDYMKMVLDLHPFAFARIKVIDFELNSISDSLVAEQLYRVHKDSILADISELKKSSGEGTELTSTMLAHAGLLDRLALQYEAVPISEVEAAYQQLIDFGNARGFVVNKQYSLLYYANFLAGASEYEKATAMVELLLKEGANPALTEALPRFDRWSEMPHLETLMSTTTNTDVAAFIETIGARLN
jgi:hypothetical protein